MKTTCIRCGSGVESIYHPIWGCRVVKNIWQVGRLNHVWDLDGESYLVGVFMKVSKNLD